MAETKWLEVSLTVDGELAEAVAEVLSRYIPGGVVVEASGITYDPNLQGQPLGPFRVAGYLPIDENLENTRQKIVQGLWYLGRIQPVPEPEFQPLESVDWVEAWKTRYRPIPIGSQLIVLPDWFKNPEPGRVPIIIEPGMAFGTGTHPTTQLVLEILDEFPPSGDVIDIGCGSGILSIAAKKLGAGHVLGVDVEAESIVSSVKNAEINGLLDHIEFGIGSVKEVREGKFSLQTAPLVLANILTHILLMLLDDGMAGLVSPGGSLVLSGILEEREEEMRAALNKLSLAVTARRQMGDWIALIVENIDKPAR